MKTKKVVRKIFDTLNYSKKKISSFTGSDSELCILLELGDEANLKYHYPSQVV